MKREKREFIALDFEGSKQLLILDSYRCPKYTTLGFDLIKSNVNYTDEAAKKLSRITEDYIKPRFQTYKKLSPWTTAIHKGAWFNIKVLTIDADRIRKQMLAIFQNESNLEPIASLLEENKETLKKINKKKEKEQLKYFNGIEWKK